MNSIWKPSEMRGATRRSEVSYWLASDNPRWTNGARIRAALIIGFLAFGLGDALAARAPEGMIAIGAAGLCSALGNRLALKNASHAASNLGSMLTVGRLARLLEGIGAVMMGLSMYWFSDPHWALIALAFTVSFLSSVVLNELTDPSFFDVAEPDRRWRERLRKIGPEASLLAAVAGVLPAFAQMTRESGLGYWNSPWLLSATALCSSLIVNRYRVRATDQSFVLATEMADRQRQRGRKDINSILHGEVTFAAKRLVSEVSERCDVPPDVVDQCRNLEGLIREMDYVDQDARIDFDSPEVLRARAGDLLHKRGLLVEFELPTEVRMCAEDRSLARAVFTEFAANAVTARARNATFRLSLSAGRWRVRFVDDGDPIDPEKWKRQGGGLDRLEVRLGDHGGQLALLGRKKVEAQWAAMVAQQRPVQTARHHYPPRPRAGDQA